MQVESAAMVRTAGYDDLAAIVAITNWFIEHSYIHFATEPWRLADACGEFAQLAATHPWLVGVAGDTVVGYATSKPWNARGGYAGAVEISIYILPQHQRRGLGSALYAGLIDKLRAGGFRKVIAGIALPNEASVRLHELLGMTHAGTLTKVGVKHGVPWDVGYWQLDLSPSSVVEEVR